MIEVDQTIFEKEQGNCFAACIASLLEVNIEDVIHFPPGTASDWRMIINEWLSEYGLFYLELSLPGDARDEHVKYWGWHIISGLSPRGTHTRHAVVGYQGKTVHDPHPSRAGLIGDDFTYGFLVCTRRLER